MPNKKKQKGNQMVKSLTSKNRVSAQLSRTGRGKCLPEEQEILSRWTDYCSELYNHESFGDNAIRDCSQSPEEDRQLILHEEVEIAVASLKKGKSVGVYTIPTELVQTGVAGPRIAIGRAPDS